VTVLGDIYSKEKRSAVMSKIRSKGNKTTEMQLIRLFKKNGIAGWRRNYQVKGHPDFVFLKKHVAVFVDGCFWHGHDCRNTKPKENEEFWTKKIEVNKERDIEVTQLFENRGWSVVRIWECELKNIKSENTINIIRTALGT
jgi:DNA mismatch endonuclease (patch repair protein)